MSLECNERSIVYFLLFKYSRPTHNSMHFVSQRIKKKSRGNWNAQNLVYKNTLCWSWNIVGYAPLLFLWDTLLQWNNELCFGLYFAKLFNACCIATEELEIMQRHKQLPSKMKRMKYLHWTTEKKNYNSSVLRVISFSKCFVAFSSRK